ncbi:DUF2993 domain-containing protein [Streptomyces sp. NPDC090306]|uniref:LmeA family phospholipid-binding protein n=1 Tax=Streptomyces sp. NPDC090306 TaxID=3365961 RepID=UPI0037FCC2C7
MGTFHRTASQYGTNSAEGSGAWEPGAADDERLLAEFFGTPAPEEPGKPEGTGTGTGDDAAWDVGEIAGRRADRDDVWSPPNHRRGGRRQGRGRRRSRLRSLFSGLPFALRSVVALVVVAAFLVLADRWAVLYAEHRAADTLKDRLHLTAAPEVDIQGFPFLTQLADRRLDSVRVTVPDVAADRVTLAAVTATLHDVRIDGDGPTSVTGVRVPRVSGDVLLSFDDLNRELGASQVTFTDAGDHRVRALGTLPVAGHDLRLHADATVRRDGERGIGTRIGDMSLDIGDVATYRPGTLPSEGLHLTPAWAAKLADEERQVKALLSVPAVVHALGVPDATVRGALRSDSRLAALTGTPRFAHEVMGLNLVDLAADHPEVLSRLGVDPGLLDGLTRLTRPDLADRISLAFRLPKPPNGELRLRDVRVEHDGIRVRLTGSGLAAGN